MRHWGWTLTLASLMSWGIAAQAQSPAAERRSAALETYASYITDDARAPEIGAKGSHRVIVEFFDYRCGFCRMNYQRIAEVLKEDETIRVVYKPYPILDPIAGPQLSELAAKMAVAVQRDGDFELYHDRLMRRREDLSEDLIKRSAREAGLSTDEIEGALTDSEINHYLEETETLADILSISGTPAYVIAGGVYHGAVDPEVMVAALDRADVRARLEAPVEH